MLPDPILGRDSVILAVRRLARSPSCTAPENRVPVTIAQVRAGHEDGDRRHRGQPLLLRTTASTTKACCVPRSTTPTDRPDAGRFDDHPAVREERAALQRRLRPAAAGRHRQVDRPQAARGPAGPGAGGALDPRARSSRATSTSSTSVRARTASARPPSATSARRSTAHAPPGRAARRAGAEPVRRTTRSSTRRRPSSVAPRSSHRMQQLGHLTAAQETAANAAPLGLHPVAPPAVADPCLTSTAPFYCDWVRSQLRSDPALGSTQADRDNAAARGRPDDQDHAQPGGAGRGPERAQRDGRAVQQRHGGRGDRPAGHRQRPRDGRQQALRHRTR